MAVGKGVITHVDHPNGVGHVSQKKKLLLHFGNLAIIGKSHKVIQQASQCIRHSCHHFTHCCLVDSHAVSYDLIKCSTCVKAQGNEDLFLYSQSMTPQGSALQLWPDQISNVVDVIKSKSKTIVKFFCCVLLERFGALGVDPLAVTSPSSMEDVNNPCHDCVLTVLSMDKKGPNFTSAETHALLQSVRNNYDSIVGSFNREGGATKVKSGIWMEVTDNVNATGSGHKRTVDQVRLRWKNLKQQATKDHSQAKNPQTGNKPYKRGQYTDVVLDIIGGQQSQSLHGIPNVVLDGESQVVNAPDVTHTIQDEVLLTHNLQPGLMTHCKSHLERENASAPGRQPEQRDDAYETLLSRDTERAEG
ncbi:hypothetical protein F7725_017627 [Dissostichus mawsoni]|uniref:Myb/SANT-like DNA-binding domain-containing protein n=1 Tax=Dissostichus mawsoni TaxID=36200 RepID=A0A7J5Z511_DISMA|nr:hypothetical protein F7725_017627 [Dissostichus mawsoni]